MKKPRRWLFCSRQIYMTILQQQPFTVPLAAVRSMISTSKKSPAAWKRIFPACGARLFRHSCSRMNYWKIWPPALKNWRNSNLSRSKWRQRLSLQKNLSTKHGTSSRTYSVFDFRGKCGGAGVFENERWKPTWNPAPESTKGTDHQGVAVPSFFIGPLFRPE